jgi:hypothetical protein
MKKLLLILLLCHGVYAENTFQYTESDLKKFSQLRFTWWGFKVYKAEVWTPESIKPDFSKEILLHITYERDIKAKDLLSTTLDEWKRLKLSDETKRKIWLIRLKKIWPDVKKGDSLTTYMNGDLTSFYQGDKLLGHVKDKEFGPAFLKIWLHKKSQTSELLKKSS